MIINIDICFTFLGSILRASREVEDLLEREKEETGQGRRGELRRIQEGWSG
jgi:hypothetical protein